MNDNVQFLSTLLMVMVCVLFVLIFILFVVWVKKRNQKMKVAKSTTTEAKAQSQVEQSYNRQSIFNFMEFDKIEDNMIIQKNGKRYLMVVQCQGVNYDLMSGTEKVAVEEGFVQFLNTLRHPIQIYVQTRTIDLEGSINNYKSRIKKIEEQLMRMKLQYQNMVSSGKYSQEELKKYSFEIIKQTNLYEYGKDVVYNTEKISLNRNVLNKQYYVIIPYYSEEVGNENFDKEEIKNLAFSELYTRSQAVIRALSVSGINSKIMKSNELIDLLYVAYNRDESEVFSVERAFKSGFDELYSTGPDILDKKMKALDELIQQKAWNMANENLLDVASEKEREIRKKEENMDDIIAQIAKSMLAQNKKSIGEDMAQAAIDKIDEEMQKAKTNKEGGEEHVGQKKKRTRRTKESA